MSNCKVFYFISVFCSIFSVKLLKINEIYRLKKAWRRIKITQRHASINATLRFGKRNVTLQETQRYAKKHYFCK